MEVRISKGLAEELLLWGDIDRDAIDAGHYEEDYDTPVEVAERYLAQLEAVRGGGVMVVDDETLPLLDIRISDTEGSDAGRYLAKAIATAYVDMGCMIQVDPAEHTCWSSGGGRCRCLRKVDGKTWVFDHRPWEQTA